MQVKTGERSCLDAPAVAEPTEDLLFHDHYTQTPRIRLTGNSAERAVPPEAAPEVMLDGNDVAGLVACAIRHPSLNMRQAVLTAIWNHPESFRQIFRFGLQAPEAFAEIRNVVAEELDKYSVGPESPVSEPTAPAGGKLLPRMPLPAHLRNRGRS
jgi:hypothetical protein